MNVLGKFVLWQETLAQKRPFIFMVFMLMYSSSLWLILGLLIVQKYNWMRMSLIAGLAGVATTFLACRNLKRQDKWGNKNDSVRERGGSSHSTRE
jgi:hypothetical protein